MSVDEYRGRLSTYRSIIISVAGELKLSLNGSVGCLPHWGVPLDTGTDD